jgi:hypothetical protein
MPHATRHACCVDEHGSPTHATCSECIHALQHGASTLPLQPKERPFVRSWNASRRPLRPWPPSACPCEQHSRAGVPVWQPQPCRPKAWQPRSALASDTYPAAPQHTRESTSQTKTGSFSTPCPRHHHHQDRPRLSTPSTAASRLTLTVLAPPTLVIAGTCRVPPTARGRLTTPS